MNLRFEWDESKAASNESKHGVSFVDEASTVFTDPLAAIFVDEEHSNTDLRELIIGHSSAGRLILVSFTERGNAVRIISARKATKHERRDYEEHSH